MFNTHNLAWVPANFFVLKATIPGENIPYFSEIKSLLFSQACGLRPIYVFFFFLKFTVLVYEILQKFMQTSKKIMKVLLEYLNICVKMV